MTNTVKKKRTKKIVATESPRVWRTAQKTKAVTKKRKKTNDQT